MLEEHGEIITDGMCHSGVCKNQVPRDLNKKLIIRAGVVCLHRKGRAGSVIK